MQCKSPARRASALFDADGSVAKVTQATQRRRSLLMNPELYYEDLATDECGEKDGSSHSDAEESDDIDEPIMSHTTVMGKGRKRTRMSVFARQQQDEPVGLLLDFSRGIRFRAGLKGRAMSLHNTVATYLTESAGSTKVLAARSMVLRDALNADIMMHITRAQKALGSRDWIRPTKFIFRKKCSELGSTQKVFKILLDEVEAWWQENAKPRGPVRHAQETTDERQKRVQKFWECYHSSFRRVEEPLQRRSRPTSGKLATSAPCRANATSATSALWASTSSGCEETPGRISRPASACSSPVPSSWASPVRAPGTPTGSGRSRPGSAARALPLRPASAAGRLGNCGSQARSPPQWPLPPSTACNSPLRPASAGGSGAAACRAARLSRTGMSSSEPLLKNVGTYGGHRGHAHRKALAVGGGALGCRLQAFCESSDFTLPKQESGTVGDVLHARYHRSKPHYGSQARFTPEPPAWLQPSTTKFPSSETEVYLRECECIGALPTPMPFVAGASRKLHAWDRSLVDSDLVAVAAALSHDTPLEEVDLEGNTLLTDCSLALVFEKLLGTPAAESLEKISLQQCRHAGPSTVRAVTRLLELDDVGGARNLRWLDLGGVPVATSLHLSLCQAIKDHPMLNTLKLSGCGFGVKSSHTVRNVGLLMSSTTIEELDLGWNCFSKEAFQHMAEKLVANQALRSLCLANSSSTAGASTSGDTPILYFLEELCHDHSLTELDISLNRITFCGSLVIEDALGNHKLEKLNISENPMGMLGLRSILRLLSRSSSGLMHFDCRGCTTGLGHDLADDRVQLYNATNPGGRYRLSLDRPYHRAILRMLYKACSQFKVKPKEVFDNISFSQGMFKQPEVDRDGIWIVPRSGKLELTFSLEKGMQFMLAGMEEDPFSDIVQVHYDLTRVKPSFRKVTPLLVQWRKMSGMVAEQTVLLEALSRDFCLSYPQVAILAMHAPTLESGIIERLLNCVSGTTARYLLFMLLPSPGEFVSCMRKCDNLLKFNVDNPTGHYFLRLDNVPDYCTAEQLLLLDQWESNICRRQGLLPVSQKGDYTRIRNEKYNHHNLCDGVEVKKISDWKIPFTGSLEFDYVSARRPKVLKPVEQDTFDSILVCLHVSLCAAEDKVAVMRSVSHHLGITSMQLREMMSAFSEDYLRAELFVCMFMRILDIWNEKVFRVKFAARPELMKQLRHRMGEITLFPFIQPEQTDFSFNLAYYDERVAASMLVCIASKESDVGFKGLRNTKYIKADGTLDKTFEATGVPRSWEDFNRIPDSGTFSSFYVCSPNDRKFEYRKQCMEKSCRWRVEVPECEVMWWAALTEAPDDVLEFMSFMVSHDLNIWEAFETIDGPGGNGVISLREFEVGMAKLGCHKFEGPNEKQRIANLFRYLDPSGEGDVSKEEWAVLKSLWSEMEQSIREFVQFLERLYEDDPTQDFLDIAWSEFDDDGSGQITEKEWVDKAINELHYFGPSDIIFHYLDKDDEGSVSFDEFMHLGVYRRRPRSPKRKGALSSNVFT